MTTSVALKWHQTFGSTFLFDKAMNDYVSTLWKLLIQVKDIENWSICLDGMNATTITSLVANKHEM